MSDIVRFRLITYGERRPKDYPISLFPLFEDFTTTHGYRWIRKIIFYFDIANFVYPYGHHPIILEHRNGLFHVSFYHFYDHRNRRNQMSSTQKIEDYQSLIAFLEKHTSILIAYLQAPTIVISPTSK